MTDPQATPPAYSAQAAGAPQKRILSLLALIFGIVGVVFSFFGGGLLFGIAGLVLGLLGRSRETWAKGFWLTGIITGAAAIVISIVVLAVAVGNVGSMMNNMNN